MYHFTTSNNCISAWYICTFYRFVCCIIIKGLLINLCTALNKWHSLKKVWSDNYFHSMEKGIFPTLMNIGRQFTSSSWRHCSYSAVENAPLKKLDQTTPCCVAQEVELQLSKTLNIWNKIFKNLVNKCFVSRNCKL